MTAISDRARETAIQIEVKKDRMAQRQSGEWAITFVLHPQEMPPELMNAKPGTRYTVALVETGDNGEPVERPNTSKEREVMSTDRLRTGKQTVDSPPRPAHGDNPKPVGADKPKRAWRDFPPAQQAGTRCGEELFWKFLNETRGYAIKNKEDAAEAVREICCVSSRSHLETNHAARIIWHQLDGEYLMWVNHPEMVA